MALTINGKKVLGYALGENKYLSVESLNAFYIDKTPDMPYDSAYGYDHKSLTIDMANYFKKADAKYSEVQCYQLMIYLDYRDNDGNDNTDHLISPLLKRGEINKKRSFTVSNNEAVVAWFKDQNTLAISTTSTYDEGAYAFEGWFAYVYGFTSQDVGTQT